MAIRSSYVLSLPGLGKSATIILGLVVLIIGLHAHYESAWVKRDFHKICILDRIHNRFSDYTCPKLSMEQFYVAIMIICFTLSVAGLILASVLLDPYKFVFWVTDLVYLATSSLLLLIAGIVYIVSAVQIINHPIIKGDRGAGWLPPSFHVIDSGIFLHTQKITAGVLAILLAVIYLGVVVAIRRGRNK